MKTTKLNLSAFYGSSHLDLADQLACSHYSLSEWTGRSLIYFTQTYNRLCKDGIRFPWKSLESEQFNPNSNYYISFRKSGHRSIAVIWKK